jgi:hypothetical protein
MNSEALSSLQIQLEHEHNTRPLPQQQTAPYCTQIYPNHPITNLFIHTYSESLIDTQIQP